MRVVRFVRRVGWLAAASVLLGGPVLADDRSDRTDDFDTFCRFVGDTYAYFDVKRTDWPATCAAARTMAIDAEDRTAFITVLEGALRELYDPHAHLGTSTRRSPRLVPSDTDLYAAVSGSRATIVDVRAHSAARAAGLRPGMRVVRIDGRTVDEAVDALSPKHLEANDPEARAHALQVALAGRQDDRPVRLDVDGPGTPASFSFTPHRDRPDRPLSVSRIDDIGVIEIHNALGDPSTIAAFDAALDALAGVRGLVLDLRDTPSGGNTTVARGLMGRLVGRETAYQRHERIGEGRQTGVRRVWMELVEPHGTTFDRPVVVLVGPWTGSMGEGIAIGLDAAIGAPVTGRPMAGLRGALEERSLPHSRIVVRVPAERLSHVNGTPRESFVPCPLRSTSSDARVDDVELEAAARLATRLANGGARSPGRCFDDS